MFGIDHARLCYGARSRGKDKPRVRRRKRALDLEALYGWVAEPLSRLWSHEPGLTGFVVEAPAHTRHYIAMALTGTATHGRVTEAWLAGSLASHSRRKVLKAIWGTDLGSTRALIRLGPDLFEPSTYEALAKVLSDDDRRRAYGDLRNITECAIRRVAEAPSDVVEAFAGRLIGTFGAPGLLFLQDGIGMLFSEPGSSRPSPSAATARRRKTCRRGSSLPLRRRLPIL